MTDIVRPLRAFSWLRWRLLVNSIRGSRRRDGLERVSRVLASIVPLALAGLAVGAFLVSALLGFLGGRVAATDAAAAGPVTLVVWSVVTLFLMVVVLVSTVSPQQSTVSKYTRLLLLPIPRSTLHLNEVLSALADPWIAILGVGLVTLAAGLAQGGRNMAAVVASIGAVLIVGLLAVVSALVSFLVAWLLRKRRRAELFTLSFVLATSLLAFLPMWIAEDVRDRKRAGVPRSDASMPTWVEVLPSRLYGRALQEAIEGRTGVSARALGFLSAEMIGLFLASAAVHRRMLGSLEGSASRRGRATDVPAARRLPFLSGPASAVAFAQAKNALRSVRGRLVVLLPGPMMVLLGLIGRTAPDMAWMGVLGTNGPIALGAGMLFSLYAMNAFTMNQFGSDRAGLTLQFLSPIAAVDLVKGKAAGCAMTFSVAAAICLACALATAPGGSPWVWLATLLGGAAAYVGACPFAAALSAIFPVVADLSKTGSGGNPHGLPMLVGTLLAAAFAVPPGLAITFLSPLSALAVVAVWAGLVALVAYPLLLVSARTVDLRRENLALVAQGK